MASPSYGKVSPVLDIADRQRKRIQWRDGYLACSADYGGQLCMAEARSMWDNVGDSDASEGDGVLRI
jgi:hypothetical protein